MGNMENVRSSNLVFEAGDEEVIHDARQNMTRFSLDHQGFMFRKFATALESFQDRDDIENIYLPEVEELLRQELDSVDRVFVFDWRIRHNETVEGRKFVDANDRLQPLTPADHAHVDQAPVAAIGRVQHHLPDEAEDLLKGRVRIINSWRPLVDIVEDRPLALCDGSSIRPSDLVEADHIRKNYDGANYYAKKSKMYKWYYLNRQRKDEITLFKNFDSDASVTPCCLHTSFSHADPPPHGAIPRRSIETRALVFTYARVETS